MIHGEAAEAESGAQTAATLTRLIQTCQDGEHGFRAAADAVGDPNLRRLFQSYSQQRAEFGAELELEVRRLAEDSASRGPVTTEWHRGWVDLDAGIAGADEGIIIEGCERAEALALGYYQKALDSGLPADLRVIVERQFFHLKETLDQIRSLERAHSRHCGLG